jgi:hypothetical protein
LPCEPSPLCYWSSPPAIRAQHTSSHGHTLAEWRTLIEPAPAELAWTEIPWRTSLWSALSEAQASERPLLLWAMNGHPLGCT